MKGTVCVVNGRDIRDRQGGGDRAGQAGRHGRDGRARPWPYRGGRSADRSGECVAAAGGDRRPRLAGTGARTASWPQWTTPSRGLTWGQLTDLTATALATDGCAGWSVCIYNPDLDPGRDGADAIISYITQAITASDQPVR
jgi:hypothetical protein